jgi:hypothetical protein
MLKDLVAPSIEALKLKELEERSVRQQLEVLLKILSKALGIKKVVECFQKFSKSSDTCRVCTHSLQLATIALQQHGLHFAEANPKSLPAVYLPSHQESHIFASVSNYQQPRGGPNEQVL